MEHVEKKEHQAFWFDRLVSSLSKHGGVVIDDGQTGAVTIKDDALWAHLLYGLRLQRLLF
jgi:hypothetical protein